MLWGMQRRDPTTAQSSGRLVSMKDGRVESTLSFVTYEVHKKCQKTKQTNKSELLFILLEVFFCGHYLCKLSVPD